MKYPTMSFDRKKVATNKNRKTFCDAFSNHFVSFLKSLTQNELRDFIYFSVPFKQLSKSV